MAMLQWIKLPYWWNDMTTYSTGNPVGSPDPRDLYDNAENLDKAINSTSDEWTDRLGRTRFTIEGVTNLATDLGTAAYRDTVGGSGPLMAQGAYGLGVDGSTSDHPLLPNFHNSSIRSGFYRWSDDATENAPSDGGGGAIRLDRGGNRAVWMAAAASGSSNEPEVFFKSTSFEVGNWGAWRKIFHTSNAIGTVSQSDGVPTGAIIERGSNANGEYVKFADGTLKMTGTFAATVDIDNSSDITAGWYRSDSSTQDFPAASVSDVKIVVSMHRTTLGNFSVLAQAFRDEKTEVRLVFTAPEQLTSHEVKADYIAWGQWY